MKCTWLIFQRDHVGVHKMIIFEILSEVLGLKPSHLKELDTAKLIIALLLLPALS